MKLQTDAEDQVGAGEELVDGLSRAGPADANGQRVVFREGALAFQRGHHRDLEKLGDLAEFVGGFGVEDALAGEDNRTLRRK